MATLHLTLKKKWFDMELSGEKTEEYREIKPYWAARLATKHVGAIGGDFMDRHKVVAYNIRKDITTIIFTNGYSPTSPSFEIECKGISIGYGKSEWGAPKEQVFIISLGKIIATNL